MARFIEVVLISARGSEAAARVINTEEIILVRPSADGNAEIVLTNGKDLALRQRYDDIARTLITASFEPPF